MLDDLSFILSLTQSQSYRLQKTWIITQLCGLYMFLSFCSSTAPSSNKSDLDNLSNSIFCVSQNKVSRVSCGHADKWCFMKNLPFFVHFV